MQVSCSVPRIHATTWVLFALLALPVHAQLPVEAPAFDRDPTYPHDTRRAVAPALLLGPATQASPEFDATYYHVALDLDFLQQRIDAGRVRAEGRVDGSALTVLRLDLSGELDVQAVRGSDGQSLGFTHGGDVLAIDLGETVPPGEAVAVEIDYAGKPRTEGFGTFEFGSISTSDGLRPVAWTLSEPYGAREWWPCKDHPSDKADSVRVSITVPAGYRVGSNGLIESETTVEGRTTVTWFARYPITTYLVSFAAGPYAAYEQTYVRPDSLAGRHGPLELPVLHYRYDRDRNNALPDGWAEVLDVLPVYEHWFGPYPFAEEKYGHAEFTWGGGMEHQTMSSMGGYNTGLVAHELAHMWFGDMITMRSWPHLWLNEGFATYATLLYWEATRPAVFRSELDGRHASARRAVGTLVLQDTTSVNDMFSSSRVYSKGAMVLHMLRSVVGDADFRSILQAYAADPAFRFGTAATADFRAVAESVSGMDLGDFFRQWVTEGTGYPIYDVAWDSTRTASGYRVHVTVKQTQEPPLSNVEVFRMPVIIEISTEAGEQRFRVENTERVQTFLFDLDALPLGPDFAPDRVVRFDPDRVLLRNEPLEVLLDSEAVGVPPTASALVQVYPNPVRGTLSVLYRQAQPGPVRLVLYDALGRPAHTLVDASHPSGSRRLAFDVEGLPGGVYVLRLETDGGAVSRRVVVQP